LEKGIEGGGRRVAYVRGKKGARPYSATRRRKNQTTETTLLKHGLVEQQREGKNLGGHKIKETAS